MMSERRCYDHGNNGIILSELLFQNIVAPVTWFTGVRQRSKNCRGRFLTERLHVSLEVAFFPGIDRLGMGDIVDQINKTSGNPNAANRPGFFGKVEQADGGSDLGFD